MNDETQLAAAALEFLGRAQIEGKEIGAFVAVHNWLTSMAAPGTVPGEVSQVVPGTVPDA